MPSNFRILLVIFGLIICSTFSFSQKIVGPSQPLTGPGGSAYICDSIAQFDYASDPDGYWLYIPVVPNLDSAHVVVFVHGYGAYNPMIYGNWISHIVKKGNVVIFPRYQKNLMSPRPTGFIPNVSTAIKDALVVIDSIHDVKPIVSNLTFTGHSYGGVISAGIAADFKKYDLPQPKVLLLCSPGSGPFKGGVLADYSGISPDTKLVVMVSENDDIVGDKLGIVIYNTATNVHDRNFIRQYADKHGKGITDHHNESYAVNLDFDSKNRNPTSQKALRIGRENATDYFGYWKILDGLMDCSRYGKNCEYALGNTSYQRFLGKWSDGKPVKELEVTVPIKLNAALEKNHKK